MLAISAHPSTSSDRSSYISSMTGHARWLQAHHFMFRTREVLGWYLKVRSAINYSVVWVGVEWDV